MKKLNENEMRLVNGGGRYFCRVCGYESNSYAKIFAHCAKHVGSWVPRWLRWSKTVVSIMMHF